MEWSIEQGKEKRRLYGSAARPLSPDERDLLTSRPQLDAGSILMYKCYIKVSTTRSMGFGMVGPIPWDRIVDWCTIRGIRGRAAEFLIDVVQRVDSIYLKKVNERKK